MRLIKILVLIMLFLQLTGCSDTPSGSLIDQEFEAVKANVKKFLGEDYEAINFRIVEKRYTDKMKKKFRVKFLFDLNKEFLGFDGKELPGELIFNKNDQDKWICTFNSGNPKNLFNIFSR